MHDTAYRIGGLVMDIYLPLHPSRILEIGAQNVNGTLRDHSPRNAEYIGLDFVAGDGVDVVVTGVEDWGVPDAHFDLVMASSVFEHDKAFWRTFIQMCNKVKPGGHIYISAPSNGTVHRYPQDYWRFYPDSGLALEGLARSEGFDLTLIESFIAEREAEVWNDFCAVFRLGKCEAELNRDFIHNKVRCTNALNWRSSLIVNAVDDSEDMRLLRRAREEAQSATARQRSFEAQLAELAAQKKAGEERLQTLAAELAKEKSDAATRQCSFETQLTELADERKASEDRLQALIAEVAKERSDSAARQCSFEAQLTELAQEKKASEDRLQAVTAELVKEKSDATARQCSLEAQLTELAAEKKAGEDRLQAEKAELVKEKFDATARQCSLEAQLTELAAEKKAGEDRLQAETAEFVKEKSDATARQCSLEAQLTELAAEKKAGEDHLQVLVAELAKERSDATAHQRSFETQLAELAALKAANEERLLALASLRNEQDRQLQVLTAELAKERTAAALQRSFKAQLTQLSAQKAEMEDLLRVQVNLGKEQGKELQSLTAELAKERTDATAREYSFSAQLAELAAQKKASEGRVHDRFQEIATLTRFIQERDQHLLDMREQIEWQRQVISLLTKGFSTSIKARVVAWFPAYFSQKSQRASLKEQGLFDANDYSATYPDVLASKTDPLRHYINHGIKEGRVIKKKTEL